MYSCIHQESANETQTGIHYDASILDHYSSDTRAVELRGRDANGRLYIRDLETLWAYDIKVSR
jgi:hypothetical protein